MILKLAQYSSDAGYKLLRAIFSDQKRVRLAVTATIAEIKQARWGKATDLKGKASDKGEKGGKDHVGVYLSSGCRLQKDGNCILLGWEQLQERGQEQRFKNSAVTVEHDVLTHEALHKLLHELNIREQLGLDAGKEEDVIWKTLSIFYSEAEFREAKAAQRLAVGNILGYCQGKTPCDRDITSQPGGPTVGVPKTQATSKTPLLTPVMDINHDGIPDTVDVATSGYYLSQGDAYKTLPWAWPYAGPVLTVNPVSKHEMPLIPYLYRHCPRTEKLPRQVHLWQMPYSMIPSAYPRYYNADQSISLGIGQRIAIREKIPMVPVAIESFVVYFDASKGDIARPPYALLPGCQLVPLEDLVPVVEHKTAESQKKKYVPVDMKKALAWARSAALTPEVAGTLEGNVALWVQTLGTQVEEMRAKNSLDELRTFVLAQARQAPFISQMPMAWEYSLPFYFKLPAFSKADTIPPARPKASASGCY